MTAFTPTPEQAAVIDHPQLPLRISAGAGTGKTTTIVQRLARVVSDGGDPSRSLGITFTNKAADELRERLHEAVPPDPGGREIEVATYHSFAAGILDEFGARDGYRGGAGLMDEGHRFELAGRVLRSLDTDVLDLTKIPSLRKDVLAVADALNDNLLDAADVRRRAPTDPDEIWTRRLALLEAAEKFREAKELLGMVEYSDLIRRAVQLVERHEVVADEIAARYDTVLLDEYQDTDRAQRRLLSRLFSGGTAVTAVGDADQTIYEWRGASLQNFEGFPHDFPLDDGRPAPTLPLSVNRRSDHAIIDLANAVRTHLPTIEGASDLVARPGAARGSVVAEWFSTEQDEAIWIAEQAIDRHEEGIPFAEMAVLCRRRDSLRVIADAFRSVGVPFSISSMSDLLEIPEVADLVAWLRVLADPGNDPAAMRILYGGRYRLGIGDLARMRRTTGADRTTSLVDIAYRATERAHADEVDAPPDAARAFVALHRDLYAYAQAASVAAIIDAIIDRLDYWSEVAALPLHRSVTARLNITRFVDLAHRWRPLDGGGSLAGFLRYLDALAEPGRAEELDAAEPPTDDAVMLLTAHGAKGLEWSDVYLPDLARNVFPSRVHSYFEPLTSAVALPYDLRLDAESMADIAAVDDPDARKALLKVRHDHQEWRLAYVAVTRAKHRLCLTGHAWHGDNKRQREPSPFLEMARQLADGGTSPAIDVPTTRPETRPFTPPPVPPDPLFPDGWADAFRRTVRDPAWMDRDHEDLSDAVRRRSSQLELELADLAEPVPGDIVEPFATSVTNLVALAECPLKFRWIHHDRMPRRPRPSAKRGTEFHRRVELHNVGVVTLDDAIDVTYDATGDDRDAAIGDRDPVHDPWEAFTVSRFRNLRPDLVETPFEIVFDGRTLRGKIDAVYRSGDDWEIVDYKSGRPSTTDAKRVQLQAYAIAARSGALGDPPMGSLDVTFAYFGDAAPIEETEAVDDEWFEDASSTVADLLMVAEEGPFPAEPSSACRWCDFLHHCRAGRVFLEDPEPVQ
jgi:DNA helicase-2/ATP-dependent DNA helicase PcrA